MLRDERSLTTYDKVGYTMNLDHYRRRLLEMEQELVQRLGEEVETVRTVRDDPTDVGDSANVDELNDEYLALGQTDFAVLTQVRAALDRIDEGTYGRCAVDGQPIEEKRLESIPWTPICLKHQRELEERARRPTPSL